MSAIEAITTYKLIVSQQELTLIGRALAGQLPKAELKAAADLNLRIVEQVERLHQERSAVVAGAVTQAWAVAESLLKSKDGPRGAQE